MPDKILFYKIIQNKSHLLHWSQYEVNILLSFLNIRVLVPFPITDREGFTKQFP